MDLLHEAKRISSDLGAWLSGIAEADFEVRGTDPQQHSAHNHEHLWIVEWLADDDPRIDLTFRRRVVLWFFDQWERRLRGYAPYRDTGYRLYLYEDAVPTVSVVAETPLGWPFGGEPSFVTSVDDVLRRYAGRSWRAYLGLDDAPQWLTPQRLLEAVTRHHGSIGTPAAGQLGVPRAQLRRLIEQWQLAQDINRIRKHYRRSAARLRDEDHLPFRYKLVERRLPPHY